MSSEQIHEPTAIENAIFRHRLLILVLSVIATLFLGYRATFIQPDTRLDRLVPNGHEFVQNAREFFAGAVDDGVSTLRVAVSTSEGDIFDYDYLVTLQKISDELSLVDGVDTGSLRSLWASGMLWFAITPEGFSSGPVIDNGTFADTPEELAKVRNNALTAGIVGSYIANDFTASMIDFQVLPFSTKTKEPLNFLQFSADIEEIRSKYESDTISIHVIGDVKKLGDLVDGFTQIAMFFALALVITAALLFNYARCWKATLVPLTCSVVAVIWQIGTLNLMGYDLGVFSVLVPFLVFAIAVSHGVQVINGIAHEAALGRNRLEAARITFHHLHRPGLVALLSDGIGFAMLFIIDIGAIQALAMTASIGVALVIFTNLVLLPVVMSYVGVTRGAIDHAQAKLDQKSVLWDNVARFAENRFARIALIAGAVLAVGGFYKGLELKIGDLDKGAPELRADSRYNRDNVFIVEHFSTSTDQMTVFVRTPRGQCETYKTIDLIDRLDWELRQTEGVQNVSSPAGTSKMNRFFTNEGNLKLHSLPRDERVLSRSMGTGGFGFANEIDEICEKKSFEVDLADHRQETLQRVVDKIEAFAAEHDDADIAFQLGFGNATFEAATNQVIERAQYEILAYVYGVVGLMVLVMFRSWRAVVCILVPLALTSVMSQGLMALLGIGVKVATLPVIALGVGIGVDYGIYIYSRLGSYLHHGHPLKVAYLETLKTTGKAVSFTGMTLAVGVATWIFSPIKFQADMGVLLTFMFLWNMIGALTLLPALANLLHVKNEKSSEPAETPEMTTA